MSRHFLKLAYDGSNYCGWQIQPDASSVQGVLEDRLSKLLREKISLTGCGRTDTGVHARVYYAHLDTNQDLDQKHFLFKLNGMLPPDIAVQSLIPANDDAHARFHATSRTYRYFINYEKDVFDPTHSWYVYGTKLDLGKMNQLSEILLSTEHFGAFQKVGSDVKSDICKVSHAQWDRHDKGVFFEISADRFLRNMVRAIVGTLVEAGRGKITETEFRKIIESGQRENAGPSAPAQGLFLYDIVYPENIFRHE
jgi:tRNA pseudouridine38-40 synthase